jgi:hypothetical protein
MTATTVPEKLDGLKPFVGWWHMAAGFAPATADAPRAVTTFEWLSGRRFLVQRWEVEHPDAPDGIAIIDFDNDRSTYIPHYFDSRGVARTYDMTFVDNVWTLRPFDALPRTLTSHSASPAASVKMTRRLSVAGRCRGMGHTGRTTSISPTPGWNSKVVGVLWLGPATGLRTTLGATWLPGIRP